MEFDNLKFGIHRLKKSVKTKPIVIFSDGFKSDAKYWQPIHKGLTKYGFKVLKISNYISEKAVTESILELSLKPLFSGGVSFLTFIEDKLLIKSKSLVFQNLTKLSFTALAIKINNCIYTLIQFNNTTSLKYRLTVLEKSNLKFMR